MKLKRNKRLISLFTFLLLNLSDQSYAAVTTTNKISIQYKLSASVLTLARLTVNYEIPSNNKGDYHLTVTGQTAGIATIADYKVAGSVHGVFSPTFTPKYGQLSYQEDTVRHDVDIKYYENKQPQITITPPKKIKATDPVVDPVYFINAADPLSQLANIIMALKIKNYCRSSFRVTDGRSIFTSTLIDIGDTELNTNSYKGKTHLCLLTTKALSGPSTTGRPIPDVSVYFANTADYPYPLLIKASAVLFHLKIEIIADKIN